MTLATGTEQRGPKGTRAFTLIELLLVLGLIAFAGSLFVVNFNSILNRDDSLNPDETMRAAVLAARFEAAAQRETMTLRYDAERGALVVERERNGENVRDFPLGAAFLSGGGGEVRFEVEQPASTGGFGRASVRAGDPSITRVYFAPDRSATPFTAVIREGTGGETRQFFEPFSGLPITEGMMPQ